MIKTRVNFKPFGEEISQKNRSFAYIRFKFTQICIFPFLIQFFQIFITNQEKYDKKLNQILNYAVKTLFQNPIV
jgi:hypothetical protein